MRFAIGLVIVTLVSCSSGEGDGTTTEPEPDSGIAPEPTPTPEPEGPEPVRFVVMGDVGEGNASQYKVAEAIEAKCAQDGCDFVVLLGDNIYDNGVSSVEDQQWEDKFEAPYRRLDMPFYPVLGNHDYGGGDTIFDKPGLGNEWYKGPVAVQYSQHSNKWTLPDTHYTLRVGNVGFMMIDSISYIYRTPF